MQEEPNWGPEEFARFQGWVEYECGEVEKAQVKFKEAIDLNGEPEVEEE